MDNDTNLAYHMWKWARILYLHRIPVLPFLLQQLSRILFCCLVPYKTKMGKNVHLNHLGMGIIINPDCVIGNNVRINQHVTLGGTGDKGCPIVEDDVYIGAGAKVLGGVRLGKGARIGANAVVLCDVPEGATAVGVPAKIVMANGTHGGLHVKQTPDGQERIEQ